MTAEGYEGIAGKKQVYIDSATNVPMQQGNYSDMLKMSGGRY
jgi:hypothetical protein